MIKKEHLIYREVKIADAATLIPLMKQLGYSIDFETLVENIKSYLKTSKQKAWVVEKEGKIIGCIAVAVTRYFHRPKSFLRVIAMVVDEKERGLGIGKSLIDIVENYALSEGCSQIELTSAMHRSGAHEFYHTLGYVEYNEKKKYFVKELISS